MVFLTGLIIHILAFVFSAYFLSRKDYPRWVKNIFGWLWSVYNLAFIVFNIVMLATYGLK